MLYSLMVDKYQSKDNEVLENIMTQGFPEEEKAQITEYIALMKNNMKTVLEDIGADAFSMPVE